MKNKRYVYLLLLFVFLSCQTETRYSSVHAYLNNLKQSQTKVGFPFLVDNNISLPNISDDQEVFYFEKSMNGDILYWFNGSDYTIKSVNVSTGNVDGVISFPQVSALTNQSFAKAALLDNQTFIWYADSSLIHFCALNGIYQHTIQLPLEHQGKLYFISATPHTHIEYFPTQNVIILPISCADEYDDVELHQMPQFALYNLSTDSIQFISIHLPQLYPSDKYLGNLMFPITAHDGNYFYAAYPLSSTIYKYNVTDGSIETITLQLPVPLTSPTTMASPINYQQMGELEYLANRINGLAVINGIIFVQQTDAWDENLQSRNFIDNTILYAFDAQGGLTWSGAFPQDAFNNIGVFRLSFAHEGKLNILSFNKNNEQRFIQLRPQL